MREVLRERPVRAASATMLASLVVALGIGAGAAAHAADLLAREELRETVLLLIAVAGFGGSVIGAGAAGVASWTATRVQGAQNAEAIERVAATTRAIRDQVQSLSREVSELRGRIEGRRR